MSLPVSDALSIQWSNVRNVSVTTASTTQSSALPDGTVAVRLVCGAGFFVRADGSASISGTGSTFVPANVPIVIVAHGSAVLSFRAAASANPMFVSVAPLSA